jgi:hypothetical protein
MDRTALLLSQFLFKDLKTQSSLQVKVAFSYHPLIAITTRSGSLKKYLLVESQPLSSLVLLLWDLMGLQRLASIQI